MSFKFNDKDLQSLFKGLESFRSHIREAESLRIMFEQIQIPDHVLDLQRQFRIIQASMQQVDQFSNLNQLSESMKKMLESAQMTRAMDIHQQQIESLQAFSPHIRELNSINQLLANSIQPLPDYSRLLNQLNLSHIENSFLEINRAIQEATFIANLEYSFDEYQDTNELKDKAEDDLIEVVPADTLEKLKKVDFAPITTLDSIFKNPKAMHALEAREFEEFIATLIDKIGFEDVVLTPRSGHKGRDILATKKVHGISILFAFECKRYAPNRPIGPDVARALLGVISHGQTQVTKGVLVTSSYFSPATSSFILTEPKLDGRDFNGITEWLREYKNRDRGT